MRTVLTSPAYPDLDADKPFWDRGKWPARWIGCDGVDRAPLLVAFRLRFTRAEAGAVRVHVSGDERYVLYVDGVREGRGPERGDANDWFYESYDLTLDAGEHTIVALVWALGVSGGPDQLGAPVAQMSVTPGCFLLASEDEPSLNTGVADWEACVVPGVAWLPYGCAWGTGSNIQIDGAAWPWGIEAGNAGEWGPAQTRHVADDARSRNDRPPYQALRPAPLPSQLDALRQVGRVRLVAAAESDDTADVPIRAVDDLPAESAAWQALLTGGGSVTVPPRTKRRVLIDLENYWCAYPELTVRGGAGSSVRVAWQEALFEDKKGWAKGHRSVVEGKLFCMMWHGKSGVFDRFLPGGGDAPRTFTTLWWQCGRYVEVVVETGDAALIIDSLAWRETRYPLENESRFAASDPYLATLTPMMVRAMQMCAHETYFDCPFYEQLMYVGDTRLEVLTTYAMTRDDRLPRKAITLFDVSRLATGLTGGLTQSRYPGHIRQMIPTFSLWWVGMVYDAALWRGDLAFVRERMPGVRAVLDAWLARRDEIGRIVAPDGWNFVDWVPSWKDGIPPGGEARQVGAIHNAHVAYTLARAAELEAWVGEPELAGRCERIARELAAGLETFWDESRGLYADDDVRTAYSEHANCLALLSDLLPAARRARLSQTLFTDPDLARTTIYYSHYLFETAFALGRPDRFFERLGLWRGLVEQGFCTTVESPEPSRSDCHAWGAHPLYHFLASVLGVRPEGLGARNVRVAPHLGPLEWAKGSVPHPAGDIVVDVRRDGDRVRGSVTLPLGVVGRYVDGSRSVALGSGENAV